MGVTVAVNNLSAAVLLVLRSDFPSLQVELTERPGFGWVFGELMQATRLPSSPSPPNPHSAHVLQV